mmetsp:Transcript_19163/g.47873  ORF Transcript_19163/g.47873 Transcript_19163/m.47873 type:complete len:219 (+) Transcript_19163:788-1444(+)
MSITSASSTVNKSSSPAVNVNVNEPGACASPPDLSGSLMSSKAAESKRALPKTLPKIKARWWWRRRGGASDDAEVNGSIGDGEDSGHASQCLGGDPLRGYRERHFAVASNLESPGGPHHSEVSGVVVHGDVVGLQQAAADSAGQDELDRVGGDAEAALGVIEAALQGEVFELDGALAVRDEGGGRDVEVQQARGEVLVLGLHSDGPGVHDGDPGGVRG